MSFKKILTVIIPAYNMEKYLDKTLSSLLINEKILNSIEVLIINDGSKDNTSKIAHNYSNKYPEVFLAIDKENGNYGSCVNAGLKIANGEFVKILDADDFFVTNGFEEYVNNLIKIKEDNICVDMVVTNTQVVDELGCITFNYTYELELNKNLIISIEDIDISILKKLTHHSVTYKTDMLKSMNYMQMEKVSYSDQEWISLPLFNVYKVIYFPICVYSYLVGREGQSMEASRLINNAKIRLDIKKHMLKFYEENKDNYRDINKRIVQDIIVSLIEPLYSEYLVEYRKSLNPLEIKKFDDFLRDNYVEFYSILGSLYYKSIPIKYINLYRNHKSKLLYNFILSLFDVALKAKRNIKKK